MAGEAPGNVQSWWKVKGKQGMSYRLAGERDREEPDTYQKSDLMRTHCQEMAWGNHLPPEPSLDMWRLQFKMRFGWEPRLKLFYSVSQLL